MVELIDISVTRNNSTLLDNISLNFEANSISCIIGQSGCGKTTLLKTLALINHPDSGYLKINNFIISTLHKDSISSFYPNLTIVFQQFQLFPHLTVLKNIELVLDINKKRVNRDYLNQIIEYFGISGILHSYPHQISIGQKQRTAFVRAVVLSPRILILDEITSALDIEFTNKIANFLIDLKNQNTTIILSTHALGFTKRIADKVIFMEKGKIVEHGPKSILFSPQTQRLRQFLNL